MNSLIDKLVSVESDANALIEQAKNEAKTIEKRVKDDIEAIQRELDAGLEQKIAAFRVEAQKRYEGEAQLQAEKARQMLAELDKIPASSVAAQVEKLVTRFREI